MIGASKLARWKKRDLHVILTTTPCRSASVSFLHYTKVVLVGFWIKGKTSSCLCFSMREDVFRSGIDLLVARQALIRAGLPRFSVHHWPDGMLFSDSRGMPGFAHPVQPGSEISWPCAGPGRSAFAYLRRTCQWQSVGCVHLTGLHWKSLRICWWIRWIPLRCGGWGLVCLVSYLLFLMAGSGASGKSTGMKVLEGSNGCWRTCPHHFATVALVARLAPFWVLDAGQR